MDYKIFKISFEDYLSGEFRLNWEKSDECLNLAVDDDYSEEYTLHWKAAFNKFLIPYGLEITSDRIEFGEDTLFWIKDEKKFAISKIKWGM
jgi:hypothetical protein